MKDYESPYLLEREELIKRLKALNLNYIWSKYNNHQLYAMLQKKVPYNVDDEKKSTLYHCNKCNASYTRDNPDLKYCEFCNEKLEE